MPQNTTPQNSPAAAPWYSIRQKTAVAAAAGQAPQAAAEIFIYGDIGESWWDETTTAAQFVKDIGAITSQDITIRINNDEDKQLVVEPEIERASCRERV